MPDAGGGVSGQNALSKAFDEVNNALRVSGTVTTSVGTVEITNDAGNPIPVSGTVTASGPVTDAQLRATPVPVSGTVTATPTGTQVVESATYSTVATGELAGSATAVQMPTVSCKLVKFKASYDNTGRVHIGGSSVTLADGSTDTTTGYQLTAGEETGWIPVANLNVFYRITTNTTDDLTYLALA